MKKSLKLLTFGLTGLTIIGVSLWGSLALWYALPAADGIRTTLSVGYAFLGAGGFLVTIFRRRLLMPLMPFTIASTAILIWWSTIEPRNDRVWHRDVAVLPSAEVKGDLITLRNVRNFKYLNDKDYTPRWYDKTVDLKQLDGLDLFAIYWMGDAIAHIILSFKFGDDYVAVSIETRKEIDEEYSTLAGFFRRYELTYVVGDEHDLIGLRTTYRNPSEDVYLYRVNAPKQRIRHLFLQYIAKINRLNQKPEFYNTFTTNCTTNITTHVEAIRRKVPLSWKI